MGLGEGTGYQPVASVATTGSAPRYLDYVMVESSSVTSANLGGNYPTFADPNTVAPILRAARGDDGGRGGFYVPDFWHQNLDLAVACRLQPDQPPLMIPRSTGGVYEDIQDGGLWPTPPL